MDNEDIRNSETSTEDGKSDIEEFENELDDEGNPKPGKKSAEARIKELSSKLKAKEEENEELKKLTPKKDEKVPTPPTPDKQKAIDYLKDLGFSHGSDVDAKIKAIEDRMALDNEHSRLASTYDGADGRPAYEKSKVEEFMRAHAVYDPEIAYKALNEAELTDWTLKKNSNPDDKKKPYVEKPGGGGSTRSDPNAVTREKLEEVNSNPTPANRAWYEKNRPKILDMMAKGEL